MNSPAADARRVRESRLKLGLGIFSAILVGIAGVLVVGLKPLLVTAYVGSLHLSHSEAGTLVAIDMAGAMAGNFLGSWKLYAFNRTRVAGAGLLLIIVGNVSSIACGTTDALALARLATGLGAGISASVMAAVLSSTSTPDRFFALYSIAAFLTSAAAMWFTGSVLTNYGIGPMFGVLATVSLVPLLFASGLPRARVKGVSRARAEGINAPPRADRVGILLLLVGTVLYYGVTGGVYSFMAQIGLERGISHESINEGLSLSQVAGAVGAVVPFVLRDRLGRALPIALAFLVMLACLPYFLFSTSPIAFAAAMSGFVFAWLMFFPYLMGVCANFDPRGRVGTLDLAVQYAGLTLGPTIAGVISQHFGYGVLLGGAAVGYVTAAGIFLTAEVRSRASAKSPAADIPLRK